jgi:hypothetical protein
MEPLSAAASIIAVIQITSKVYELCTNYYLHAKHAKDDIRRLKQEVDTLQDILLSITDLSESGSPGVINVLEKVTKDGGLLDQCRDDLTALLQKLNPSGSGNSLDKLMFNLKWPFSRKDLDVTLDTIERYKSSLALATASEQTYGSRPCCLCHTELNSLQALSDRDTA